MQQDFPPKSLTAVPPRRLGGLANTGPLSSRGLGWSAIEEQGAFSIPASCFFPRAPFLPEDHNRSWFFSSAGFSLLVFLGFMYTRPEIFAALSIHQCKTRRLKPALLTSETNAPI